MDRQTAHAESYSPVSLLRGGERNTVSRCRADVVGVPGYQLLKSTTQDPRRKLRSAPSVPRPDNPRPSSERSNCFVALPGRGTAIPAGRCAVAFRLPSPPYRPQRQRQRHALASSRWFTRARPPTVLSARLDAGREGKLQERRGGRCGASAGRHRPWAAPALCIALDIWMMDRIGVGRVLISEDICPCLPWRKRRRSEASLSRTRSPKHISFWMRSGHPSFVDEAPEDQSRKESM
jgi:hypothetical protein